VKISAPTAVAILGGNSVVGRSLEVLLEGGGYSTRIIEEPVTGKPQELLEGIRLLLVAPTPDTDSREGFLASMGSVPGVAAVPVLRLSTVLNRVPPEQAGLVLWPCRLEDLKSEIEAALRTPFRAVVSVKPGQ
jgi:hypothetical protein